MISAGAGTDICRRCSGPKEPTRVKSQMCRACDKGSGPGRVKRFRLSLSIPLTTFDRLTQVARERDISTYEMARRVLDEWAREGQEVSEAQTPVTTPEKTEPVLIKTERAPGLTNEQLARAQRWMVATDRRRPDGVKTRRQLRAWLLTQGFKP